MAYEKQLVQSGDVITDEWGNHIQTQYDEAHAELVSHMNDNVSQAHKLVFKNYEEVFEEPTVLSGQITLDMINGNVFRVSLTENTEFIFSNPSVTNSSSITLILTQDGTARAVTWPASVKWSGGNVPDLSTASKVYILTFVTVDAGATWFGFLAGDFDVS